MTAELQTINSQVNVIPEHYLFEKRLHSKCRGVLREKGNLYSIRYVCNNPVCPQHDRVVPLDEIVLTFEEVKRIDETEITENKSDTLKQKQKPQLRLTLHIENEEPIELETFWYRYFVYQVSRCFKCNHLRLNWKYGLGNAYCPKVGIHCKFSEKWDI